MCRLRDDRSQCPAPRAFRGKYDSTVLGGAFLASHAKLADLTRPQCLALCFTNLQGSTSRILYTSATVTSRHCIILLLPNYHRSPDFTTKIPLLVPTMFVKTHFALTALLHLTTAAFWDGPQATAVEKRATDSFRPTPTPTFYPKAKGDIHRGVCGDYIIGNLSNPVSNSECFPCNDE